MICRSTVFHPRPRLKVLKRRSELLAVSVTSMWVSGAVSFPETHRELAALTRAGVVGFKCFLIHSGVDEFPNVTEKDLRTALPELARLGAVLIVHAEVPGPINRARRHVILRSRVKSFKPVALIRLFSNHAHALRRMKLSN